MRAQTFSDIESRLDPTMAAAASVGVGVGAGGGGGSFDAAFCHLRRVLFWLEITCSTTEVEDRMRALFNGLTAFRDDQHKVATAGGERGGKLSLEDCVCKMSLLDMSQLIWLHLRRGELGMAQERCRLASGGPQDHSGGRQWWRAALLEGAGFTFEPSQRAAFANSDYKTWYEKRYQESYHFAMPTAPIARLSPMAWVRYTKMCHRHLKQLDPHRHPGGAANLDRPEFIRSGFDLAIFALFAGDRVLEDSNLWKDRSHWQRVLQEAGVLETWEDELWLELRDLFTSEIKRSFEEQSSLEELLMSKIASAVDHVETSVAWYEGGEMGMGAKSLAKVLGRVQRDLVAMDIQGLVCSLEEEAAEAERRVKQQQQSEESAVLLLGVMAHVCLSLKVTLFMHGGQALVDRTHGAGGFEILAPGTADPQKESKWEEAMEKVLRGIDNVCKAYVQQLIIMGSWADVPVTLRLIMNHAVRGPHQGGGPLSEAFNKVLARVEADNEAHVHMLAVRYLQAFEIDVADAHERRERMDDLKLWVGADMFKKAGHDMVSKLDGNAEATIDVGERVHELFQPRYGDWYQVLCVCVCVLDYMCVCVCVCVSCRHVQGECLYRYVILYSIYTVYIYHSCICVAVPYDIRSRARARTHARCLTYVHMM